MAVKGSTDKTKEFLPLFNSTFFVRFLRDGYRTPREDSARLYYERWELRMFENIECEWPLFYSYLILFHLFQGNKVTVSDYAHKLDVNLLTQQLCVLNLQ